MDKYYEQMTPAYKSKLYSIYNHLSISMVFLSMMGLVIFLPSAIVFSGLAVVLYFLKQKEYVEYEYIFTSGDIDIDRIIEAKKRKSVVSFNMSDVAVLAPEGSNFLDGTLKGKKITAYTHQNDARIYVAVVSKDNSVSEIYFTPDEKFINLCFRSNPKSVKKV